MVQLIIIIYRIDTVYRWSKLSWESPSNLMLLLPWCWPCWKKNGHVEIELSISFFLLSQKAEALHVIIILGRSDQVRKNMGETSSFFFPSFFSHLFLLVYKDLVLLWRILKIRLVHLLHSNFKLFGSMEVSRASLL